MALIGQATPSRDIDVLVVCTANVCRSPYVAALLRQRLPGLTVAAAGTAPVRGVPLDPRIAPMLSSLGATVNGVAGHRLTRRSIQRAHVVLTATVAHRQRVCELDPRSPDRVFTLKEFARLLSQDAADRSRTTSRADSASLGAIVALAHARRTEVLANISGGRPPGRSDEPVADREPADDLATRDDLADADDLADPYGGSTAAYREMFAQTDAALARIVAELASSTARPTTG